MDERSMLVLSQVVHATSYLPVDEITKKLHISRRTLYYDLRKINTWLQDYSLEPVKNVRSFGLYISDNTKEHIPSLLKELNIQQYYFSEKERKALLAISLIMSTEVLYLKDLAEKIRVSRGTVINELNKLKDEISSFHLLIKFDRSNGYLIIGDESNKRKALIHYLSLILSKNGWDHLLSEIQFLLHAKLNRKQVGIEKPTLAFIEEYLPKISQIMSNCVSDLDLQITDEMFHNLVLRLLIFSKRLLQGSGIFIDKTEKDVLQKRSEYQAAKHISNQLEKVFQFSFPEDEICYLTMNLLGTVNYDKKEIDIDGVMAQLIVIIDRMVADFQKYACVFFQEQMKLRENLLKHLKPTYYRLKYDLEIENPLIETLKQTYSEVFILTKRVTYYLEDLVGKTISEDEIGYIAMYFGGWLKREGSKPKARKKALVVCGNGVSTSQLLQSQIENLLPTIDVVSILSLREFSSADHYGVDFIVSTVPIEHRLPVFIVNPILTEMEKDMLLNQFNSLAIKKSRTSTINIKSLLDIIRKHTDINNETVLEEELAQYFSNRNQIFKEKGKPVLSDLITEDVIQLQGKAVDWQDAIRIASDPLLKNGSIQPSYITAMIQNIKELGPYVVLAPKIAIPHARPEQGVNRIGMSLLTLKDAVSFTEDGKTPVNLLIILAAVDSESHLKALAQLSELLSADKNVGTILQADSKDAILQLVNHYSV